MTPLATSWQIESKYPEGWDVTLQVSSAAASSATEATPTTAGAALSVVWTLGIVGCLFAVVSDHLLPATAVLAIVAMTVAMVALAAMAAHGEGAAGLVLRIRQDTIQLGGRSWQTHQIRDVRLERNKARWDLVLVLDGSPAVRLFSVRRAQDGTELLDHLRSVVPSNCGSEADVPAGLRALRARERSRRDTLP